MCTRSRRIHSALSDEMIRMAVEQFLPSLGAGLLLTILLLRGYSRTKAKLLLWSGICFAGLTVNDGVF